MHVECGVARMCFAHTFLNCMVDLHGAAVRGAVELVKLLAILVKKS